MTPKQIDLTRWSDAWAEAEASGNALSFTADLLAQVIDEARYRVKRHKPDNPDTPEDFLVEAAFTIAEAEVKSMRRILRLDKLEGE